MQRELRDALLVAEEKPEGAIFIIPARLEAVDVPKRLAQWQWADLFQQGGYQRLVQTLRQLTRVQPETERAATHDTKADVAIPRQEVHGRSRRQTGGSEGLATEKPTAELARGWPRQESENETTESMIRDEYEVIHPISRGHYSEVLKCIAKKTGGLCVVKRTAANRVNVRALTAIGNVDCANLAKPRRIWELPGSVFEGMRQRNAPIFRT